MKITKLLIFVYFLSIIIGCSNSQIKCENVEYYFPFTSENIENFGLDSFVNKWYSKHLLSMNEPNFQCTKVCEQIRLTFLPTWGNPEIFRIEKCGFDINGFYKKTNGAGGYDQGDLAINEIKELTIKDWNLMNAKFSKLKSNRLSNEQNGGLDGSIWLIERIVKEKYEYIERWTLERKDIDQELFEYCKEFQNITRSR